MNKFKLSKKGFDLIKEFEGLELKAYLCPANVLTVGYGHVVRRGEPYKLGSLITKDEAEKLLLFDSAWAQDAVNRFVSVPITQQQFDALVSFTFNLGQTTFRNSTLLKLLNNRKFSACADFLLKYVFADGKKLRGLVRRRNAERNLFLSKENV
jgi:lysozyme